MEFFLQLNPIILEQGTTDGVRLPQISWFYRHVVRRPGAKKYKMSRKLSSMVIRKANDTHNAKFVLWVTYGVSLPKTNVSTLIPEEKTTAPVRRIFKKPQFDTGLVNVHGRDYFSPLRKSRIYIKSRFSRVRQWCRPIVI